MKRCVDAFQTPPLRAGRRLQAISLCAVALLALAPLQAAAACWWVSGISNGGTFTVSSNGGSAAYASIGTLYGSSSGPSFCCWSPTSDCDWLRVSSVPFNGNRCNDGYVSANALANTATTSRTAAVTITGGGGTFKFYVKQSGVPCSSVTVDLQPQGAVAAGAQWRVDSGAWQNSGATVSTLDAGPHVLSFNTVEGWNTPAKQTITTQEGQSVPATGAYTQATATLRGDILPRQAVDAGAQWSADFGPWQAAGTSVTGLRDGSRIVSFSDLAGWITPDYQYVTVAAGQTAATTGIYVSTSGSVTVDIQPQQARDAGAQWRVDGGAWQAPGDTVIDLGNGTHTVDFSDVAGWTTPAGRSVTTSTSQAATTTGTYASTTGALCVTIEPQAARDAGAQWRVDGGAWQASGATVSGLSLGPHSIEGGDAPGWTTPATATAIVAAGQTATQTLSYAPATGSLSVTIRPQRAVNAGAQWRVDAGPWQDSGTTLRLIAPGQHTIAYAPVRGWMTPRQAIVAVQAGSTVTAGGVYAPAGNQAAIFLLLPTAP